MKIYKKTFLSLLFLSLLVVMSAAPVWAITAANTQIVNNAQLSYFDGVATQVKSAATTVTVTLVPAAPVIAIVGGPYSTNYSGATSSLTDTFTITAAANGPDTYNLTAGTGAQVNNSSSGTATPGAGSVTIGATVTVAGSTTTVINVPSDGINDAKVNGLAVGDTVVINGEVRTVASIVDNTTGTSTITLNLALNSAPAAGVLVAGQKTVTVTVVSGTIVTTGTSVEVPANLTATSNTDNTKTTTSTDAGNTYYSGLATFVKYVRNVTNPIVGATPHSYGGNTYYVTGVTAKPGEVLEYALVSTNSGTGPVTASVVTDGIPTAYVVFKDNVYSAGTRGITYVNASDVESYLTVAAGDDAGVYVASMMTVNVGTGAGIPPAAGGSIAAGETVRVLYQVTVNP